ncbi:MAG: peroxiredoxin [Devosia sp.]
MIQPGDVIPAIPVKHVTAAGVTDETADKVLGGGRVVFFAVPGAFTPTCHANHLPGFVDNASKFSAAGVHRIVCGATNDQHVLKAWAEATGALGSIEFLSDGNGALAKAMGLDKDLSKAGMGTRFSRLAMIIDNGRVERLFLQEEPGVTTSGAPSVLMALEAARSK